MSAADNLKIIAHIHTDFPEKFGVPRQSGLIPELTGTVVFEPEYRNPDALRGLEEFDYIWLIWGFEGTGEEEWSPTVRPPRLGGNKRMGVFATRSPFRPNAIALSSVKLESVKRTNQGPVLYVSGIDMKDNTPIYDIKPYIPYADSHPDARGGFTDEDAAAELEVHFPQELLKRIPTEKQQALLRVLGEDPRPRYQDDAERIYGMEFDCHTIRFRVEGGVLQVTDVT